MCCPYPCQCLCSHGWSDHYTGSRFACAWREFPNQSLDPGWDLDGASHAVFKPGQNEFSRISRCLKQKPASSAIWIEQIVADDYDPAHTWPEPTTELAKRVLNFKIEGNIKAEFNITYGEGNADVMSLRAEWAPTSSTNDAESTHLIGSGSGPAAPLQAGDTLRIEIQNPASSTTTITWKHNGVEVWSETLSAKYSTGWVYESNQWWCEHLGNRIDFFGGGQS